VGNGEERWEERGGGGAGGRVVAMVESTETAAVGSNSGVALADGGTGIPATLVAFARLVVFPLGS